MRSDDITKTTLIKLLGLVGTSRKSKMKKVPFLKISLLVQIIGEI